jgi:DNA polymerase-3 subunit gamma/tau
MPLRHVDDWLAFLDAADLKGPLRQLASHCVFCSFADGVLRLFLPDEDAHLRSDKMIAQLTQSVSAAIGSPLQIRFEARLSAPADTLHMRNERQRSERQLAAEASFVADPVVSQLLGQGGSIVPGSIQPISSDS